MLTVLKFKRGQLAGTAPKFDKHGQRTGTAPEFMGFAPAAEAVSQVMSNRKLSLDQALIELGLPKAKNLPTSLSKAIRRRRNQAFDKKVKDPIQYSYKITGPS